jgi:hypothetical protein
VTQPLEGLRVAVRAHPQQSAVTLAENRLWPARRAACCVQDWNTLYRQSATFRLEAGEHRFVITAGGSDTNYFLPVAFLAGPFAGFDGKLAALPEKVMPGPLCRQGLGGFCGSVTYRARVTVPRREDGGLLGLDTGGCMRRSRWGNRILARALGPHSSGRCPLN